ncbi:MAG TPA: GspMb/PilO family protein [Usitatibacter sp.]|jgi:type II secretion system (T2SS) protein M|nr:GspMb/PilO family protein [Usitatibacter sp.]
MKSMRWLIGRSSLGWPGAAAVCLLLLAASAQYFLLRPLQGSYDTGPATPVRPADVQGTQGPEQERTHGRMQDNKRMPRQLERLGSIAAAHGIALAHAEYHLLDGNDKGVRRYHVTLPVAAPYPAIRAFIGDVFEQMPTAALEQLAFERRNFSDAAVEAQIRLTVYVEP